MLSTAFIIKPEWGERLLGGKKTMELRGSGTKKRGWVGLIYDSAIQGEVEIVDSVRLDAKSFAEGGHCFPGTWEELRGTYAHPHGWVIRGTRRYETPRPYVKKRGQVIWVTL